MGTIPLPLSESEFERGPCCLFCDETSKVHRCEIIPSDPTAHDTEQDSPLRFSGGGISQLYRPGFARFGTFWIDLLASRNSIPLCPKHRLPFLQHSILLVPKLSTLRRLIDNEESDFSARVTYLSSWPLPARTPFLAQLLGQKCHRRGSVSRNEDEEDRPPDGWDLFEYHNLSSPPQQVGQGVHEVTNPRFRKGSEDRILFEFNSEDKRYSQQSLNHLRPVVSCEDPISDSTNPEIFRTLIFDMSDLISPSSASKGCDAMVGRPFIDPLSLLAHAFTSLSLFEPFLSPHQTEVFNCLKQLKKLYREIVHEVELGPPPSNEESARMDFFIPRHLSHNNPPRASVENRERILAEDGYDNESSSTPSRLSTEGDEILPPRSPSDLDTSVVGEMSVPPTPHGLRETLDSHLRYSSSTISPSDDSFPFSIGTRSSPGATQAYSTPPSSVRSGRSSMSPPTPPTSISLSPPTRTETPTYPDSTRNSPTNTHLYSSFFPPNRKRNDIPYSDHHYFPRPASPPPCPHPLPPSRTTTGQRSLPQQINRSMAIPRYLHHSQKSSASLIMKSPESTPPPSSRFPNPSNHSSPSFQRNRTASTPNRFVKTDTSNSSTPRTGTSSGSFTSSPTITLNASPMQRDTHPSFDVRLLRRFGGNCDSQGRGIYGDDDDGSSTPRTKTTSTFSSPRMGTRTRNIPYELWDESCTHHRSNSSSIHSPPIDRLYPNRSRHQSLHHHSQSLLAPPARPASKSTQMGTRRSNVTSSFAAWFAEQARHNPKGVPVG